MLLFVFLNFVLLLLLNGRLQTPTDTARAYSPAAVSLLEGNGYRVDGVFYTHHPPLFSAFLAMVYGVSGVRDFTNTFYPFLIVVLQSLTVWFLYLFGKRTIGESAGRIAAWLYNFYPFFIILTATKYAWTASPLFLFLFFAACALWVYAEGRPGRQVFAGFLLGFSALTWSGAAYVFLLFTAHDVFRKKSVKLAGIFLIGFLIPTLSWSLYASAQTGKLIFVSSSLAPSMADGLFRHEGSSLRKFALVQEGLESRQQGELKTPGDFFAFYAEQWVKKPWETANFILYKASRPWYGTDSEKFEKPILLLQIPYIFMGALGFLFLNKSGNSYTGFFLGLLLYFWAVAFTVLSIVRYMMPAFGILMLFAGVAMERLVRRTRPSPLKENSRL